MPVPLVLGADILSSIGTLFIMTGGHLSRTNPTPGLYLLLSDILALVGMVLCIGFLLRYPHFSGRQSPVRPYILFHSD